MVPHGRLDVSSLTFSQQRAGNQETGFATESMHSLISLGISQNRGTLSLFPIRIESPKGDPKKGYHFSDTPNLFVAHFICKWTERLNDTHVFSSGAP